MYAHIDRPVDALIFEGKTYETYSQPLGSFVGNDKAKKRLLSQNPTNPRLPKHYYATYEIKDSKLYLNKVEIIKISDATMRKWRIPLALTYELVPLEAEKLFGSGATYPILCNWYSGVLFSTIFDGSRFYLNLFNDNYYFSIKEGEFLSMEEYSTRNIFANCVSKNEAHLIYKFFTDKSFGYENKLIDLRAVADLSFLNQNEFLITRDGKPFKTRAFFALDKRKNPCLYMPRTANSEMLKLSLIDKSGQDISEFKTGDRVEAIISISPYESRNIALVGLRKLNADELIFSPDFSLRLKKP